MTSEERDEVIMKIFDNLLFTLERQTSLLNSVTVLHPCDPNISEDVKIIESLSESLYNFIDLVYPTEEE